MDVFKRFPTLGKILAVVLHPQIKRLTKDTAANEDMAIDLVKRSVELFLASLSNSSLNVLEKKNYHVLT